MRFHRRKKKTPGETTGAAGPVRRPLFRKYATILVGILSSALIVSGAVDVWFSYQEQKALLVRVQHEQAQAAAAKITQFINQIRSQMGWVALVSSPTETFDEWRFDVIRLLRQEPALTELAQFTPSGREQFRLSRYARDLTDGQQDHSHDPLFMQARASEIAYGPVSFVGGSEPFMTIAMAAGRGDQAVLMGQVNLKFIWDIVSQIKAGNRGQAYLVDGQGRLIAHPDLSLVLKNTDMSVLPQVDATKNDTGERRQSALSEGIDLNHRAVLSAHAPVPPLNWLVFVDVPLEEAYAPLYGSIGRSAFILAIALALALFAALLLARRMVGPIHALHSGAARIAAGDLTQRIAIHTDDELAALGDQFNIMAERLHDSYATLEDKVEQRTRELELANQAKSRFLAAASHDLRQPLHALGLFVSQLRGRLRMEERNKIVDRIENSLSAMNQLFIALLDISKLDAGAMSTNVTGFPVSDLLDQVESTFTEAAREKGLSLRIVNCGLWIRSDFILLQRIVFNLVSNAIRYTNTGTVLVGCRRNADTVRIEVCDNGVGIPADQHQHIFTEFYRLGDPERDRRAGIGLGLAIVDRLCRLLGHPITVSSTPG